jgi:hypothetical protein
MTEAVMVRYKVLLVGGMDYNVPPELKDSFEIVRHITQGSKFQQLPQADYVLVITEWASHNLVEAVKNAVSAPVIFLPRGWAAMKELLEARSILTPQAPAQAEASAPSPEKPPSESLFSSMTESDVWKKYGQKLIEAAQGTLRPKEVVAEEDILEALSLSGVPKADCAAFLPRLQMKGILDPCEGNRWRLMAAPGIDFENDRVEIPSEKEEKSALPSRTRRSVVKSPSMATFIAGLNKGPYASKRAIYEEMRKYKEFDALSDHQVKGFVERAIKLRIIDDTNRDLFVNQDLGVFLTRKEMPKAVEPEMAPEKAMEEAKKEMGLFAFLPKQALEKVDAEKSWCHVVEEIRKERERLANVLVHCRIEWMGGNNVLCIFLPAVLSQWMKFVESTENWGLTGRIVQEKFGHGTVIRFMVDNGLRT